MSASIRRTCTLRPFGQPGRRSLISDQRWQASIKQAPFSYRSLDQGEFVSVRGVVSLNHALRVKFHDQTRGRGERVASGFKRLVDVEHDGVLSG